MHPDTAKYNDSLASTDKAICNLLAREIQWDYKNIVKRKGRLDRLK
jgi:hypothetical protein